MRADDGCVIFRRRRRAGDYARKRYRRALRSWQARNRLLMAALFGPFVLAGWVVLFLDRHLMAWVGGLLAGGFTGAWIAVRESPPSYIEHWLEGAEGERKTEKALAPLERHGWRIVHDVQARYGNYDHIAVGPAGTFLIETKNPNGIVELHDGVPYVRRRHDPDATARWEHVRPRALKAAVQLKEDLQRHGGRPAWVQAVVVFWDEFPAGLIDDGKCIFVHGPRLHALLHGQASRLSENEVAQIAAAVEEIARREPSDDVASNGMVPSGA